MRNGENRQFTSAAFINHSETIVLVCRHVNCCACCSCCSVNSSRDSLSSHRTLRVRSLLLLFEISRHLVNGLIWIPVTSLENSTGLAFVNIGGLKIIFEKEKIIIKSRTIERKKRERSEIVKSLFRVVFD